MKRINLHLTNVTGLGAMQLAASLLPELEKSDRVKIVNVYLPSVGGLSTYQSVTGFSKIFNYYRILPHLVSRLVECLNPFEFDPSLDMLVIGDVPIRSCNQILFIQNAHVVQGFKGKWGKIKIKYYFARLIFKFNIGKIKAIIVQSEYMKNELLNRFAFPVDDIYVVRQPPPTWITEGVDSWRYLPRVDKSALKLFYPASFYPHKNHSLLNDINGPFASLIDRIVLTLNPSSLEAAGLSFIDFVGKLDSEGMLHHYKSCDALLFLSKFESYGFPLIEAMSLGLPIVCPDLPYARELCMDGAFYFNPDSVYSLNSALNELKAELDGGWVPDWTEQLQNIPRDWLDVSDKFAFICSKY